MVFIYKKLVYSMKNVALVFSLVLKERRRSGEVVKLILLK
jgi:hypothetical protein